MTIVAVDCAVTPDAYLAALYHTDEHGMCRPKFYKLLLCAHIHIVIVNGIVGNAVLCLHGSHLLLFHVLQ